MSNPVGPSMGRPFSVPVQSGAASGAFDDLIAASAQIDKPSLVLSHLLKSEGPALEKLKQYGALDVGAGGGRDTRYLLSNGWNVTAQDTNKKFAEVLADAQRTYGDQLEIRTEPVEHLDHRNFGLVTVANVLPFVVDPQALTSMLEDLHGKLVDGGILSCNFFGESHAWKVKDSKQDPPRRVYMSELEARQAIELAGFKNVRISHAEAARKPDQGPVVHWHDIYVIAVKAEAGQGREDKSCCAVM